MNKKIIIIVIIVLCLILALCVGVIVIKKYNSTNKPTNVEPFDTQEIRSLNLQFEDFLGKQKGSQVSILIEKLIDLANNDDYDIIPSFTISDKINSKNDTYTNVKQPYSKDECKKYKENLRDIQNKLELLHDYIVEVEYNSNGVVNEYVIIY